MSELKTTCPGSVHVKKVTREEYIADLKNVLKLHGQTKGDRLEGVRVLTVLHDTPK
jgi:hypothetical protein